MKMERLDRDKPIPTVEEQFVPESIILKGEKPLWYALLTSPDAGVPDEEEVRAAKAWLREVFNLHKQAILSCKGRSIEEARQILQAVADIRAARMVL